MSHREIFVKRIGLIGIASLLLNLNGIILLPILTKNLSISDYGVWVQIVITIDLISTLALLGLPNSMVRFLPSAEETGKIRDILYSIALIIALSGLVVCTTIYLLSAPIASACFNGDAFIVELLSIVVFIECLNNIAANYFRAMQQIKKYAGIISLKVSVNIILIAYFVTYGYGIHGAICGLLISATAAFLGAAAIIIPEVGINIPKFENIGKYLSFGIPTLPGTLSSWIVSSSDRYVIGLMLGTAAVGFYSPGYTLGFMIIIFMAPVSFLLPAILSKYYDENNMAEVKILMEYSMKYFLSLAIPSAFGLSILSYSILGILSTSDIAKEAYLITPFIALSALLYGIYSIISHILILENRTSVLGKIWLTAAILNLGLNLLLIPFLGILGAAITTFIAYALAFAFTAYSSFKYWKFSLNPKFVFKCLLSSFIMSSLFLFWYPIKKAELLEVISLCALIYCIVLLLLGGFSKKEIAFIRGVLKI